MTGAAPYPIVGVILTRADLRRAGRLENLPDFLELRLDALVHQIDEIEEEVDKLMAPIVITARHPAEGGLNNLSPGKRRMLLSRFLPRAAYLDVELRSVRSLAGVLRHARALNVGVIVSFHDFKTTPSTTRLDGIANKACSIGADYLKIATRSDKPAQVARLRDFFLRHQGNGKIAVMGMGKLGGRLRLEFAARGSALNYAHLGSPGIEGQPSVAELRKTLKQKEISGDSLADSLE